MQANDSEYASFGDRIIAGAIDWSIILVLSFCLMFCLLQWIVSSVFAGPGITMINDTMIYLYFVLAAFIAIIISGIISVLYFGIFESSAWRGGIGKRAIGIMVVDECGHRLSVERSYDRAFGKWLSILLFFAGIAAIMFSKKKQSLHDRLGNTFVTINPARSRRKAKIFTENELTKETNNN